MTTVYLHIGMPKTGTTALQEFLAKNRSVLELHGIAFPDFGFRYPGRGVNRNGFFLTGEGYTPEGAAKLEWKKKEYFEGLDKLRELAGHSTKIILSDEGMWWGGNRRELFWREIQKDFEKIGVKTKIIMYLRRQDDFVQSHWAQLVKAGDQKTFAQYLEWARAERYPLDYEAYLEKLEKIFGRENLIVRVYEKGQFAGAEHTVFSDFLGIFGLGMSDGFEVGEAVYNTSLQGDCLEIRRIMNEAPEVRKTTHALTALLKEAQELELFSTGKEIYFDSEEAHRAFMETYKKGNEQVAKTYLNREDGRLFYAKEQETPVHRLGEEKLLRELAVLLAKTVDSQSSEITALRGELRETKREIQKDLLWFRLKRKIKHLTGMDKKTQSHHNSKVE